MSISKETWIDFYIMNDVLGTFQDLGLNHTSYYFQQDGDLKHCAGICQDWFEAHDVDVLPWVPSSPDMNMFGVNSSVRYTAEPTYPKLKSNYGR